MEVSIPVFQFEIRFNHILNFGQLSKKILAPFVKFTTSLKIDGQNTLNEKIILNFEEEDYYITVSWDRIIIKGQGKIKFYTSKNSPVESTLFGILDKIKELEEFESIKNVLLAITYLQKKDLDDENLIKYFSDYYLNKNAINLLQGCNDIALTIEANEVNQASTSISFGPYYGVSELGRRPLAPINLNKLDDFDFKGIMVEYKKMKKLNSFSFSEFVELEKEAFKSFNEICKTH